MNTVLKPFVLSLTILVCLIACKNEIFKSQNLIGAWKVDSWKIEETGKVITNKMDMNFNADGNYSIDYGPKNEKGRYWIDGEFLHTVESEQAEKTVKIISLGADTMRLKMNRGGQLENVVMVKR